MLVPWAELILMGSWCVRKPLSHVSVTLSSSCAEPTGTERANDRCLLDEAGGGSRAWSLKVQQELPGGKWGRRHFSRGGSIGRSRSWKESRVSGLRPPVSQAASGHSVWAAARLVSSLSSGFPFPVTGTFSVSLFSL